MRSMSVSNAMLCYVNLHIVKNKENMRINLKTIMYIFFNLSIYHVINTMQKVFFYGIIRKYIFYKKVLIKTICVYLKTKISYDKYVYIYVCFVCISLMRI